MDILIKSDIEEAMKLLVRCIQEERQGCKTNVEEAPKGSKGSNGIVERAVQEIEAVSYTHLTLPTICSV
eukprot:3332474-Karenia_brevis.AAC.1